MAYVELVDAASCLVVAKPAAAWNATSPAEFKRELVQELNFSILPFPHLHVMYLGF